MLESSQVKWLRVYFRRHFARFSKVFNGRCMSRKCVLPELSRPKCSHVHDHLFEELVCMHRSSATGLLAAVRFLQGWLGRAKGTRALATPAFRRVERPRSGSTSTAGVLIRKVHSFIDSSSSRCLSASDTADPNCPARYPKSGRSRMPSSSAWPWWLSGPCYCG